MLKKNEDQCNIALAHVCINKLQVGTDLHFSVRRRTILLGLPQRVLTTTNIKHVGYSIGFSFHMVSRSELTRALIIYGSVRSRQE